MTEEERKELEQLAYCGHKPTLDTPIGFQQSCEECRAWLYDISQAYSLGEKAQRERDAQIAKQIAEEVGGKFWETHRLNTGLLKFIDAIRKGVSDAR